LDEVAYLRYASVYRNFSSLEDFEGEIALLRALPFEKTAEADSKVASPQLLVDKSQ
jgi:transcriptional repressor NrdR